MVRWLRENPPQDIDILSPINQREIFDGVGENTVEILSKQEDLELQYEQFADLSQGTSLKLLSHIRTRYIHEISSRNAGTFVGNA
jgi:hypothetical protein